MAKPFARTSLAGADIFGSKPAKVMAPSGPAITQTREHATGAVPVAEADVPEARDEMAGLKRRVRYEKPHVSLYASEETFKAIKRLALDEGTTAQALYRKGLLMMMKSYGIDRGMSEDDI